jgi:hypothetical protein
MPNTHVLRYDGAPHTATSSKDSTTGPGSGVCSCGAISIELPSRAERKAWFKEHLNDVAAARDDEDLLGFDPEPELQPQPEPGEELVIDYPYAKHYFDELVRDGGVAYLGKLGYAAHADRKRNALVVNAPGSVAETVQDAWDAIYEAFRDWKKTDETYREVKAKSSKDAGVLERDYLRTEMTEFPL